MKRKSVGIITFHHYYNYGTMLQAYALQRKIEAMGFRSELIDFKQDNSLTVMQLLKLRIKRIPIYIKEHKKYTILASAKHQIENKNKKFDEFYQRNLKVGGSKYTNSVQLNSNPPQYDGYVVGSDQTWNPYASNNPEAYYLTFVQDKKKVGAYAPSMAVSKLTDKQKTLYKTRLKDFQFLSCRESVGAQLLSQILNREVEHVLDPTLLLDWDDWQKVCSPETVHEPYILTYFLGDIEWHRKFVQKLARKTNLKVLSIPISYLDMMDSTTEKKWIGPDQFLSLIKNAEYVCTDSFHGTMFSINFGVQFFAFCKTDDADNVSENSRLYSALALFDLSARLVDKENESHLITDLPVIDYSKVYNTLSREREKSVAYLEKMLNAITE